MQVFTPCADRTREEFIQQDELRDLACSDGQKMSAIAETHHSTDVDAYFCACSKAHMANWASGLSRMNHCRNFTQSFLASALWLQVRDLRTASSSLDG